MNIAADLSSRLKEVLIEGKWVAGTNFKDEITSVSWEVAQSKHENLNTIADLTFHVHYYIAGVAQVLEGGALTIRDKFSFDAPTISSEKDWNDRVALFEKDAVRFIILVEQLSDEVLKAPFVNPKYGSLERNIDVLIEHSYYHLGQVVLLKKLLTKKGASH